MILWTTQEFEALEAALRRGHFRADGRRHWRLFHRAYGWLSGEMAKRIGPPPSRVRYPMWSWVTRPMRNDYKHDLALIAFEADEDEFLVSDFDSWHAVLNNGYHALSMREDREMEKRGIKPSQRIKEKSWARIFVPAASLPRITRPGEERYQATLWTIPVDNIVSVSVFRARKRLPSQMSLEELRDLRRGIVPPPPAEPFRIER